MTLYAAYASNLDPAQMRERCPESPLASSGWLEGWRLTFGGEDLGWEGADSGLYRKLRVRVHTLDGDEMAWLYVLDSYEGGLPSARYLGLIAEAAEAAGAPDDYVTELRRRPCRSVGP